MRKATVWALLFLPLVAVGVAAALMLGWGHQSTQQAEANDPGTKFQISTPNVNVPVNGQFLVTLDMSSVGALAGSVSNWQGVIGWTPGLTGAGDPSSTKAVNINGCAGNGGIGATAAPWLGIPNTAGAGCAAFNPPTLPDVEILKGGKINATFELTCGATPSVETVQMIINLGAKGQFTSVGDGITDAANASGSTFLQITCVPPDGSININLVADDNQSKKLADSCWLISVDVIDNSGSVPLQINKPVAVIADNNAKPACDVNIKKQMFDKNPAIGAIDVNVSGKNLAGLGNSWSFQQIQTNAAYTLDPVKYTCTLSGLFVKTDGSGRTACDEADPFTITNVRKTGVATITMSAKPGLNQALLDNLCVIIDPGANKVCAVNGKINTTLSAEKHTITAQTTKNATESFHLDPTQVPGNGDAVRSCDLATNGSTSDQTCNIVFSYASQNAFLDVSFNEVNQKGQVVNTPTGQCVNISPNLTKAQSACQPISQVRIGLGDQTVTYKAAGGFVATNSPQVCNVPAGATCVIKFDLKFVGIPAVNKMVGGNHNVWLDTKAIPNDCNSSSAVSKTLSLNTSAPTTRIDKETIDKQTGVITPDKTPQVVAGAEVTFMLKDQLPNGELACISVTQGGHWAQACTITPSADKQSVKAFCATKKANLGGLSTGGQLNLFNITISGDPILWSLMYGTQDNGTLVQVLSTGCNLTDQIGGPVAKEKCPDADITFRQLEGDVNRDCSVDIIDQQLLAFRWGIGISSTLFSQDYDLVNTGLPEINIKDVQFVFGRSGSVCSKSGTTSGGTNPEQLPLKK